MDSPENSSSQKKRVILVSTGRFYGGGPAIPNEYEGGAGDVHEATAVEAELQELAEKLGSEIGKATITTAELVRLRRLLTMAQRHLRSSASSESSEPFYQTLLLSLLPPKLRRRVMEPTLEEIREDRLIARSQCIGVKLQLIEVCFAIRCVVVFLQSLLAWIGDILSKLSPWLKAILFGSLLK